MPAAWRAGITVAVLATYALVSQQLMVHAAPAPYTVALLFGPLLAGMAGVAWHQRQWAMLAACGALVALLAAVVLRGGVLDAQRLYVLQHGGIHAFLGWSFGLTLRPGQTPLITGLARAVHERLGQDFSAGQAAYTRGLTQLWVAYFLGMVLLSALLYLAAPWPVWTFYCTIVTPLAAVALFVGEHLWRAWRHPEFPKVSMRAAFAAYQAHQQRHPQRHTPP